MSLPDDLRNTTGAINVVFDSRLAYVLPGDTSQNYMNFLAVPVEQRLTSIGRIDLQSVGFTVPPHNLNNTNNTIYVRFRLENSLQWNLDYAAGLPYTRTPAIEIKLTPARVDSTNFQGGVLGEFKTLLMNAYTTWLQAVNAQAAVLHPGTPYNTYVTALFNDLAFTSQSFLVQYDGGPGLVTFKTVPASPATSFQGGVLSDSADGVYAAYPVLDMGMQAGTTDTLSNGGTLVGVNDKWASFFGWNDWGPQRVRAVSITPATTYTGTDRVSAPIKLTSFDTFLVRQPSLAVGTSNNFYDSNHDAVGRSLPPDVFFTFDTGVTLPGEDFTHIYDKNSNNTWFYPSGLDLKSLFEIKITDIYGQTINPLGFKGAFRMNLKCYPL